MLVNKRNQSGVKDGNDCYLRGGEWKQWTDFGGETLEEAKNSIKAFKTEYPRYEFKSKKMSFGYRIYYKENNAL